MPLMLKPAAASFLGNKTMEKAGELKLNSVKFVHNRKAKFVILCMLLMRAPPSNITMSIYTMVKKV